MAAKHLCLLLLAVVAFGAVSAQSEDELPIPMENDNHFPPVSDDEIQGSGDGTLNQPEEPISSTSELPLQAPLEEIEPMNRLADEVDTAPNDNEPSCPERCLCSFEDDDFVINCSGLDLTELPSNIDSRTTKINIQNNKLTEIPKHISSLQNLKFLDASKNSITELCLGSISELGELVTLDLSNNRLIEYPSDLKNSISLTKLEELNLGSNDLRTELGSDTFSLLTSLRQLTVPASAYKEQLENTLCKSLKESLKTVCVDSCNDKELTCPDSIDEIDNENESLLDAKIPGAIFSDNIEEEDYAKEEDYADLTINSPNDNASDTETKLENTNNPIDSDTKPDNELTNIEPIGISKFNTIVDPPKEESPSETANDPSDVKSDAETSSNDEPPVGISKFNTIVHIAKDESLSETADATSDTKSAVETSSNNDQGNSDANINSASDFSLRSAVNKEPGVTSDAIAKSDNDETKAGQPVEISKFNGIAEVSKDESLQNDKTSDTKDSADYKIGAKTLESSAGGGVDKSVIGMIVAGMVLVVAGVVIKKNWSSIKKRFSSNSRTPNDRPAGNANGTTPEEVPLQDKDKSPV